MANVGDVLLLAETLSPEERVSLIARLWKSLPQESWPRPVADELAEANRLLAREGIHRNESVPWPLVERMLADSVRSSRPKVYSAPRRFDLATFLVVTAGYAILFAVTAAIVAESRGAARSGFVVAAFVTLVGLAQAFLYGGRRPRTASILAGAAIATTMMVGVVLWSGMPGQGPTLVFVAAYGAVAGIVYGYVAGVLVGGAFLAADYLRRGIKRIFPAVEPSAQQAESPFDAS